jgi:hypothetical protein
VISRVQVTGTNSAWIFQRRIHKQTSVNCNSLVKLLLVVVMSPWASLTGTRAHSGDRYGTLHSRQVLRGSLPLLSPAFRRSHPRHQMPPRPHQRERS